MKKFDDLNDAMNKTRDLEKAVFERFYGLVKRKIDVAAPVTARMGRISMHWQPGVKTETAPFDIRYRNMDLSADQSNERILSSEYSTVWISAKPFARIELVQRDGMYHLQYDYLIGDGVDPFLKGGWSE